MLQVCPLPATFPALALVESVLEKRRNAEAALKFETLVVEMLDLTLEKKLGCPFDIPDVLSEQGWDPAQVANLGHVSTDSNDFSQWDSYTLEALF